MITVTDTQRTFALDHTTMKAQAQRMLNALSYSDFDLGILVCGEKMMRDYNRTYRGKDKVTDVLSFPFHEGRNPSERIVVADPEEQQLGDLILCPRYIAATCHRWERDFDTHLTALLAHGIAHLLGHDHITDEDYAKMKPVEEQLIAAAQG